MVAMEFADLVLGKIIFEIRFRSGYLYWDNCGRIWLGLSEKWPNLEHRQIDTTRAEFQIPDGISMSFSHERFGIDQDECQSLKVFAQLATDSKSLSSQATGVVSPLT